MNRTWRDVPDRSGQVWEANYKGRKHTFRVTRDGVPFNSFTKIEHPTETLESEWITENWPSGPRISFPEDVELPWEGSVTSGDTTMHRRFDLE